MPGLVLLVTDGNPVYNNYSVYRVYSVYVYSILTCAIPGAPCSPCGCSLAPESTTVRVWKHKGENLIGFSPLSQDDSPVHFFFNVFTLKLSI